MKKFVLGTLLLAVTFSLGGCLTTDIGSVAAGNIFVPQAPVGKGPVSSGTGFVAEVVRIAQTTCNYRPSAAVVGVIAAAEPLATTAETIANAFCAGVAPLASGPGMVGVRQGYARVNGHYYSLRTGKRVFLRRHKR